MQRAGDTWKAFILLWVMGSSVPLLGFLLLLQHWFVSVKAVVQYSRAGTLAKVRAFRAATYISIFSRDCAQ